MNEFDPDGHIGRSIGQWQQDGPFTETPHGRMAALDAESAAAYWDLYEHLIDGDETNPIEYVRTTHDLAETLSDIHKRQQQAFEQTWEVT